MRKILLTKNRYTIVDNKDYEYLTQWKWYAKWSKCTKSFYAVRHGKKKNNEQHFLYMAREILGLKYGDNRQADHINHNTLDNRNSNLRIVTLQQNHWNNKNPKGYYLHKASKKYLAHIGLNGKRIYLGLFRTTKEAHNAYLQAKEKYHRIEGE